MVALSNRFGVFNCRGCSQHAAHQKTPISKKVGGIVEEHIIYSPRAL